MDPHPAVEELRGLLRATLPTAWAEAAADGDRGTLDRLRAEGDDRAIVRMVGEAGWLTPGWPPAYGGRGLDAAGSAAVAAELERWRVPRGPTGSGLPLAAPTILEWSSEETKQRFLPPMASGEERWCQLFSEPGAGSDLASVATTAVRDGDEWVVNGQKVWTTLGHESEMAMLLARTDPAAPKHAGITYFGLDLRSPGVEVRPLVQMTGECEFNEVFLSDVRVPELHRISPLGKGWGAALTTLGAERFALSGAGRGRGEGGGGGGSASILGGKSIDEVLELARRSGLLADPARRDRCMQEYVKARVLRLTGRWLGAQVARGALDPAAGSLTKIMKAATNQSLQVLAAELLGARSTAWTADDDEAPSVVRELLRTRANSIEGGTSEVQRNIVGERLLGLGREPDPYKGAAWKDTPRS